MTSLDKLQSQLKDQDIDLAVITRPQLIDYFTGYASEPMERILALFVSPTKHILFAPYLDARDAKDQVSCPVLSYKDEEDPWQVIQKDLLSQFDSPNRVGVEDSQLTLDKYKALSGILRDSEFIDIGSLLDGLKLIKSKEEKDRLLEAGDLADKALQVGLNALKVGISEVEVVAKIDYEMKKLGVSKMSFPTMVLFGDHAGSPHGVPGSRKLQAGEFVLFDLGVLYQGYASDMSRTVFFGEPEDLDDQDKAVYQTVLKAQETAMEAAKPGMTAGDLDKLARQVIDQAGYGQYFIHRLGHGIGQTAHESPSISSSNTSNLQAGMAFSIEPGIYIPGQVGVRIEDCVYLNEDGAISLTQSPKNLQFLPAVTD